MSFVLAIGVDFALKEVVKTAPRSSLPTLRDTLQHCERPEYLHLVTATSGFIEVEPYDRVDAFIRRLTAYCTEYNKNRPAEDVCYFVAVCWKGDDPAAPALAQMLLTGMMSENRATRENLPVAVLITADTYAKIPPKFQDTYRSSIELQDVKVHKRFPEGWARCFIISPIGEEGSLTRQRADEVFETYIKPACDGTQYRAVRGEMMRGDRITPDVEEALQTSSMVIAYLGSPKPGWNPNVMYEYGRRAALGLPVVVLKDSTVDGRSFELPFDLKDERFVDLPETTPTNIADVAPKIRTIREHMQDPSRKGGWTTIYPSATVDIVIGGPNDHPPKYIEASGALEVLFELPNMKGRTTPEVIEHLTQKMLADQSAPFLEDQRRILGNLVLGSLQPTDISARVPIVFEDHATLRKRAYLPIIVSHLFIQPTNTFRLNVVYIEVTAATHRKDEKYFRCDLVDGTLETEAM